VLILSYYRKRDPSICAVHSMSRLLVRDCSRMDHRSSQQEAVSSGTAAFDHNPMHNLTILLFRFENVALFHLTPPRSAQGAGRPLTRSKWWRSASPLGSESLDTGVSGKGSPGEVLGPTVLF
jgi:hypothetical protein